MRREITLFPASDVVIWPGDTWPNGSPYGGSPQITLWEAWSDSRSSDLPTAELLPDDYHTGYSHGWVNPGHPVIRNPCLMAVGFEPPPTQALFTKLTFRAWWDYSGYGPNGWYFPPTVAHGPRARLAVRNRARDGWLYQPAYTEATTTNYCRINATDCGGSYGDGAIEQTWELTSHPEGGVFTLDDMVHLAAGIEFSVAVDGSNNCFDNSTGGFQKIRCLHFNLLLEIIDLGGFVKNIRFASSEALRFSRLPRREVGFVLPLDEAYPEPGTYYSLAYNRGAHPRAKGWREEAAHRRRVFIGPKVTYPDLKKVEYSSLDLHGLSCLAWASLRTSMPWSPELNGMAYLDAGGYFSVDRNQDAWAPRPGDGVLVRVLEDYLKLDYEGSPVEGSGDEELQEYNTNPGNVNAWAQYGVSGGITLSTPDGDGMVEELGYTVSARVEFGGAGTGVGGYESSPGISVAANDQTVTLGWRVGVRNVSVSTPASQFLEAVLLRTHGGGTEYWDAANRAWGSSIVYNAIPSDTPYGEIVSDNIPTYVSGQTTATYKVRVGRWSSALQSVTFVLAIVNLQLGDKGHGVRSPLVTLDSSIVRVGDVYRVENPDTKRIWFGKRGVCIAEFRPGWRADHIHAGPFTKPVVYAHHSATEYDRLDIVPVDASTRSLRFRRRVSGVSYDVSAAITTDLTREHVVRAWARWLDSDGWDDYGPYTISVGFAVFNRQTSLLVEQGQAHAAGPTSAPTLDADAYILPGTDGSGGSLDGWLRWWETLLNPITADEIVWRW